MRKILVAAFAFVALGAYQVAAQTQINLANPGFETTLTDPPTSDGDWFPFSSGSSAGGSGATTQISTDPHGGAMHMAFELTGTAQFAGVFQNVGVPVSPGQRVVFTGWSKNASGAPFNATQEIKLEWQATAPDPNPPQNRVDVLTLGSDYTKFTHTGIAPPGTTGLVVTYAVSNFGAGQGAALVYLDDMHATIVPEPAAAGLMGMGLLALLRYRRK